MHLHCVTIIFIPYFTLQFGKNTLPSDDVTPVSVLSNFNSDISDYDLSLALRKGKRICTSHLLSNFVSYFHLTSSYNPLISSVQSYLVLKSVSEAILSQDREMSCKKK